MSVTAWGHVRYVYGKNNQNPPVLLPWGGVGGGGGTGGIVKFCCSCCLTVAVSVRMTGDEVVFARWCWFC